MADDRQERIIAAIRTSGGRVTPARRALVEALVEARSSHVTAEDLAGSVQKDHPDVHLSTIYRSLDTLEHLGVVDHVHLGHGRAVYHLADQHHQHLVCEVCSRVVEVPDDVFDQLGAELRDSYGFTIRPKHFAVIGRCARCSQTSASPG